jgi:hypothetical protein
MSCPSWSTLVVHRYRRLGEEPAGWQEALCHLETCERCRREALLADPTLLFVDRMPVESTADPAIGVGDVLARARLEEQGSRLRRRIWLAAAAALILTLGLSQGVRRLVPSESDSTVASPARPAGEPVVELQTSPELPLIDGLANPETRVYQVAAGDMDFVVIVDASLDL